MRVPLTTYAGFGVLLAAIASASKPANVDPPVPADDDEIDEAPPLDIKHPELWKRVFQFSLEPTPSGVRHLVLRDDKDLRLPLGDVAPFWACDTASAMLPGRLYTMRVECGDEAVGATVSVDDSNPWTRSRDMTVRVHGEYAANYTVKIPAGIHPELHWGQYMHDPQVDCDPSGPHDVEVSVERRALPGATRAGEPVEQFVMRASGYPFEAVLNRTSEDRCWVELFNEGVGVFADCYDRDWNIDRITVLVDEGAILWRHERNEIGNSVPTAVQGLHGGWRLGCGATVRMPPGVPVHKPELF